MNRIFIGNNIIRLSEINSTNQHALQLLKVSPLLDGTVIIADAQTQGKGQRGNTWQSEPHKNLTLSIILYPKNISADKQFVLTQIVSLGILDFVEKQIEPQNKVNIKWPNDIFVNNKKIAGVLTENSLRGNEINTSVIGIGLNVNQQNFNNLNTATSLKNIQSKEFNLQTCLDNLCSTIEARYMQFLNKKQEAIQADYLQKLFQLEEIKKYEINEKIIEAKIVGVNKDGKLLLKSIENKAILECDLKEIKFL